MICAPQPVIQGHDMVTTSIPVADAGRLSAGLALPAGEYAGHSGVSWAAILAGAAGAAALSLILFVLGSGLGMTMVSPWADRGVAATTFGITAILWITLTQLIASGFGGYLAGRLRTKWTSVHTDEVYFRDTAHGFLAWAVATLATAALLGSVIGSLVSTGVGAAGALVDRAAGAAGAAGAASGATGSAAEGGGAMPAAGMSSMRSTAYYVDSLFRRDATSAPASAAPTTGSDVDNGGMAGNRMEVGRIFANSLHGGALPADDQRYVAQLVAQRTGLSQQDAEKRVGDVYARTQAKLKETEAAAKDAGDKARKASAYASLWLFISLLIGAFTASLAATYGGGQRDA
jgi:hypothetical protein